jgi:hypothetical protein
MAVRFRKHLILPTVEQDQTTGHWTAMARIQFTDNSSFHNVLVKRSSTFRTKSQTEKYIIQQARQWIEERLHSEASQ